MSPIKLLISDVDGTLVDREKHLTPAVVDAVRRLTAAGCGFTIISARPRSGMAPIADTLAIDQPMGAFNGGLIYTRDGGVQAHHTIDPAVAHGVFECIGELAVERWLFADDCWYSTTGEGVHVEHERIASNQREIVGDLPAELLDRADKITFVSDEPGVLAELKQRIDARFAGKATIGQSQIYYLDITAVQANKGAGVTALTAAIGVDLAATAVIGDQNNDLPMIGLAGYGVAMGNAPVNVQAAAAAVSTSNDADGVAHAIDRFILPRIGAPRP